ncbi:MAG TPA: LuxR C-terminal-related transcriptional regulator [Steroidobacter sp.]|jgi:FixJ family two-component response regulator|nr:LuxR C-terminal-related transcriptional regulator [Steroidobacter sp.]
MTSAATVFVVAGDYNLRRVLAAVLNAAHLETQCFGSGAEFLARYDPSVPGCILLEWLMSGLSGFDVQSRLTAAGASSPIIFMSSTGAIADIVCAMRAGAINFLAKPVDQQHLIAAVEEVVRVDGERRRLALLHHTVEERLATLTLTPREREVLAHVVAGRMNKQIAGDLGTVVKTIKVHRARVMRKMRVRSLAQLIHLILESGVAIEAPAGEATHVGGMLGFLSPDYASSLGRLFRTNAQM